MTALSALRQGDVILVTGGAGFIGSHVLVELIQAGYQPVVLDDLSNSCITALDRVGCIAGRKIPHVIGDVRCSLTLAGLFAWLEQRGRPVRCVVHLAGCKAVGESVRDPLKYYDANVGGTTVLLRAMLEGGVHRLVFSSSATVYGTPHSLPMREDHPLGATNPYGRSKLVTEGIIQDLCKAEPGFAALALRYFNPIGAHPSGLIGECPGGEPSNLFPYMTQVAIGARERLMVFGDDYSTVDGTGARDYLHVMDLARGHVNAVEAMQGHQGGMRFVNLGTGLGTSVLQLLDAFEQATGIRVPYSIAPRRSGDVASMWADTHLAATTLGWSPRYGLKEMCEHGWNWQRCNPDGYVADSSHAGVELPLAAPVVSAAIVAGVGPQEVAR